MIENKKQTKEQLEETLVNLRGHLNNIHKDMSNSKYVDQVRLHAANGHILTGLMCLEQSVNA